MAGYRADEPRDPATGRWGGGGGGSSKSSGSGKSSAPSKQAAPAKKKRQSGGVHPAHFGTNSSRPMGGSGAGRSGGGSSSGGGGYRGSGPGSNPGQPKNQQTPQSDGRTTVDPETGVRTTRFNNDSDQKQAVRLSPAAREQVNKFRQQDSSLYHNSGSVPHAATMAKQIAASHGAHSTGVLSLPRSMKMTSKASANPGHAGPAPHGNSSEKFTRSGVPKDKRDTLSYGDGTKL
jgi:hypothetical protein